MKEKLLSTLDSVSPRWKFVLTASLMLTIVNFVIGIFGPFSPAAFTLAESQSYIAFGVMFGVLAWLILAKGPKVKKRDKRFDKVVMYANGSMAVLSVFTGLVAIFFSIPVLENEFGREAGHLIFFRIHGLATAVGLLMGVIGITVSILVFRKIFKYKFSLK